MSNQELTTQLHKLKGTVKALFNIIGNTATEDNKREAKSPGRSRIDRLDHSLNSDMDPILMAAYDQSAMPTTNLAQEIVIMNIVKGVLARPLDEGMVDQRVLCPNVVLGSIVQMNAISAHTVVPAVQNQISWKL
uniref:Uncharacterized protein n=1 Tax=Romanomermis culicivorax TaxID=13658 RepID=A0A915IMH9_ROMCU